MVSIAPAAAAKLERIPAALWCQAAILVGGGFLSRLTTSIVNIGLAPMGEGFGVPLGTMQWVATGYLLALAASIPISAWTARRVGPTRLWFASLALFILASVACALSAAVGQLIAARVLLGLCGGLLVPVGQMLLGMAAGPARMGRVMGTMGLVVVLAPAIGSTVGSALLLGLALIAGFVLRARRMEAPLIRIRLLRERIFGPAGLILFCGGFTVYGAQIALPLYYLLVRHETVLMTGLLILPQDFGIALAMPLSGRLADRFGGGRLVLAGVILTVLGTVPLALLEVHTSYLWLSAVLAVRGFGMVLSGMPAMTAALASLPQQRVPDGVPLLNILDRTGASIGAALAVALFGLFLPPGPSYPMGALVAFDATHGILALVAALPLLPALILLRAERRARG
ncbi:MAG TPA: MFS transporter [Inquilinus sp.]|nr:MFS transporter [Inquilinus sp.]